MPSASASLHHFAALHRDPIAAFRCGASLWHYAARLRYRSCTAALATPQRPECFTRNIRVVQLPLRHAKRKRLTKHPAHPLCDLAAIPPARPPPCPGATCRDASTSAPLPQHPSATPRLNTPVQRLRLSPSAAPCRDTSAAGSASALSLPGPPPALREASAGPQKMFHVKHSVRKFIGMRVHRHECPPAYEPIVPSCKMRMFGNAQHALLKKVP